MMSIEDHMDRLHVDAVELLNRGDSAKNEDVSNALENFEIVLERLNWLFLGSYGEASMVAIYWHFAVGGNTPKALLSLLLRIEWNLNTTGVKKFLRHLDENQKAQIFETVLELIEEDPRPNHVTLYRVHEQERQPLKTNFKLWKL